MKFNTCCNRQEKSKADADLQQLRPENISQGVQSILNTANNLNPSVLVKAGADFGTFMQGQVGIQRIVDNVIQSNTLSWFTQSDRFYELFDQVKERLLEIDLNLQRLSYSKKRRPDIFKAISHGKNDRNHSSSRALFIVEEEETRYFYMKKLYTILLADMNLCLQKQVM